MSSNELERPKQESPIITSPSDPEIVERLMLKSEEYRQRVATLGQYTHPEQLLIETFMQGSNSALDAMLKAQLLDKVIADGEVKVWEFQEQVISDPLFAMPIQINKDLFTGTLLNACLVIGSYCQGDESLVRGGTGLR